MVHLIDKNILVTEIKKRLHKYEKEYEELAHYEIWITAKEIEPKIKELKNLLSFLDTLEVIDPYEQCVQYDSIKSGIQAHAETYSFNIESELYNQQTTKEGQKLWRKEIEQAFVIGGEVGVELARDPRYKENLEVKEVNLEKEAELIANGIMIGVQANKYHTNVYNTKRNDFNHSHLMLAARKGIELGIKAQKGE